MTKQEKPFKGTIENWERHTGACAGLGLGYQILGTFKEHPEFKGMHGNTSYLVMHNSDTGEIETKNSRYILIGPETK